MRRRRKHGRLRSNDGGSKLPTVLRAALYAWGGNDITSAGFDRYNAAQSRLAKHQSRVATFGRRGLRAFPRIRGVASPLPVIIG